MAENNELYRVEIPIVVDDQTGPALQEAQRKVSQFERSAQKSNERIRKMFGRDIQVRIGAIDRAWPVIRSIQTRLSSVTSKAWNVTLQVKDKVTNTIKGLVNKLLSPLTLLGAGAGVGAGILFPLKLAGEFEQARMSLDFYMGGVEKGKKAFEDLVSFAAKTPFEFSFLQGAMIQLMGTGYNFDQAKRALTAFGDAAGRTGAGMQGVEAALLGFTQIASAGTLNLQDLKQVALNLKLPLNIFAKELGVAESKMGDIGKAGISSQKAMEAIVRTLEKRFAGGMKQLSSSLFGLTSTIKDTATLTVWHFGKGLAEPVTRILFDIVGLTDDTGGKFEEFQQRLEGAGKRVGQHIENIYNRIKQFWGQLSSDPEFQRLDFGDKLIYLLNLALDKIDAWMEGEGGQRLQGTLSKLASIAARTWFKALSTLGETSVQQLREGDIKGALLPAAIMWGLGGGLIARGAWGLGKGLFGAGKWALGRIGPGAVAKTAVGASAAATAAETAAATTATIAGPMKLIYGPSGQALSAVTPTTTLVAPTAATAVTTAKTLSAFGRFSKVAGKAAIPLAVATELVSVATAQDKVHAASQSGVGLAGLWGGGKLGAAIGTALLPGVGTIVGGALGSLGGYFAGRYLGGKIIDTARGGARGDTAPSNVPISPGTQPQLVVNVRAESKPTYNIETAADAQEVLRIIRANERTIADQLADDIANKLTRSFNNMTLVPIGAE